MTDLINKVDKLLKEDIDTIQAIVTKYSSVLQLTKTEKDIPYLAYIIDVSVNHINKNHKDLSQDWKTWSALVIRNKYFDKKIKHVEDIPKIINDFVEFWKTDYEKYCKNIVSASEYDRDMGFVYKFLWKKNR